MVCVVCRDASQQECGLPCLQRQRIQSIQGGVEEPERLGRAAVPAVGSQPVSRPRGSAAVAIRSCEGILAGEDTRPGASMFALVMTVIQECVRIIRDSKVYRTVEND